MIWDEAHFGKFGSHYLKREFYFDVHPPLGKMLVGLAGLLSGYNGGYEFKSGEMYPEDVPFVAMRVILATFGVLMVPLGWYTAIELGMSTRACHLVALMCLCGTLLFISECVPAKPSSCDRYCMAGYFAFYTFGFDVALLYLYHRLRSFKVPQSTIPVRLGL